MKWLHRGAFRRSSYLQTPRERAVTFFLKANVQVCLALLVIGTVVTVFANPRAQAAVGDTTFEMYVDAPFVENSYVYTEDPTNSGTFRTSFTDQTPGSPCAVAGAASVEVTPGHPGGCNIYQIPMPNGYIYGSPITSSSDPTVGNLGADETPTPAPPYAAVNEGESTTISYSAGQHYFGIWWTAGSPGNHIAFYNDNNLIAETDAYDVENVIGSKDSTGSVTSTDGANYASTLYYDNPVDVFKIGDPLDFSQSDPDNRFAKWADVDPDKKKSQDQNEVFTYLHFFAQGGQPFNKVVLSSTHWGFEFSNIVTSDRTNIVPSDRLVHVKSINQPAVVSFDANGGSGNLPNQTAPYQLTDTCPDYSSSSTCITGPDVSGGYSPWAFLGWNTNPDGSGTSYNYSWSHGGWPTFNGDADTILYAQWGNSVYYDFSDNYTAPCTWDDWPSQQILRTGTWQLPTETSLPDTDRTCSGWHIDHWEGFTGYDSDWNETWAPIGAPGSTVSLADEASFFSNSYGYPLRAIWASDSGPSTPPPSAVVQTTIPVDPRVTTVTLPAMPLTDASTASVCLDEVDSNHTVFSSSLTFTVNGGAPANRTGTVTVSGASALVAQGPRFLRYRVATSADTSCSSASTYYIELRPLGLSDKRSSNADIN